MTEKKFYDDSEVADILGITVNRLRAKLCGGENLPARIQPPNSRYRLWKVEDVHDWLETYRVGAAKAPQVKKSMRGRK